MYPSVQAAFRAFNEPFEGVVPWMYLDVKGLVTVGVGNLIDPVELALHLPFRFRGEPHQPAGSEQISEEWQRIKSNAALGKAGYRACEALTRLRLDDAAIDALIHARLGANEVSLKKRAAFVGFDGWPADAQLGLLSMAWGWVRGVRRSLRSSRRHAGRSILAGRRQGARSTKREIRGWRRGIAPIASCLRTQPR